jgi:hypothetical protein
MRGLIDNDFDGGLMPAEVVSAKFARKLEMEITQLRKERDEARRIACDNEARHNSMMFDSPKHSDPRAIAESHGWDCFKQEDGK